MSELRWNPLLRTYTMVASNRQVRPNMPKNWCPFCPGSGKVPPDYDVYSYANDFPTLSCNPLPSSIESTSLYNVEPNYGRCEVILYSPDHTLALSELSEDQICKLIGLWAERTKAIYNDSKIKYVFVFENRGKEVGVTMPHPHGQIYGYPFIPLKVKIELDSCKEYFENNGRNMFLDINNEERNFGKRVILENDSFLAFIPFFTDYPYGVFIVSKNIRSTFMDLRYSERSDLAFILKNITGAFDTLYDKAFPYMMCVHQAPLNVPEYKDSDKYYNFHIEFYPPLRDANAIKYYASSEMGGWAAANTKAVEETAEELRVALNRYIIKNQKSLMGYEDDRH